MGDTLLLTFPDMNDTGKEFAWGQPLTLEVVDSWLAANETRSIIIHNKQVASAEGYYNESESIIQSANFNTTIFKALVCAVKYSNLKNIYKIW